MYADIVKTLNECNSTNLILNIISHITLDKDIIDDFKLDGRIKEIACTLPILLPAPVIEWAITRVIYWEANAKQDKDILEKFKEFTKPPIYKFFISFMEYYNRFWPQDIKNKFEQDLIEEFANSDEISLIDKTTLCAHAFRLFMDDAFYLLLVDFLGWVLEEKRTMNNIIKAFPSYAKGDEK